MFGLRFTLSEVTLFIPNNLSGIKKELYLGLFLGKLASSKVL